MQTPSSVPPALQAVTCQQRSAGVIGSVSWAHSPDTGFVFWVCAVLALCCVSFFPLSLKGLNTEVELPCRPA